MKISRFLNIAVIVLTVYVNPAKSSDHDTVNDDSRNNQPTSIEEDDTIDLKNLPSTSDGLHHRRRDFRRKKNLGLPQGGKPEIIRHFPQPGHLHPHPGHSHPRPGHRFPHPGHYHPRPGHQRPQGYVQPGTKSRQQKYLPSIDYDVRAPSNSEEFYDNNPENIFAEEGPVDYLEPLYPTESVEVFVPPGEADSLTERIPSGREDVDPISQTGPFFESDQLSGSSPELSRDYSIPSETTGSEVHENQETPPENPYILKVVYEPQGNQTEQNYREELYHHTRNSTKKYTRIHRYRWKPHKKHPRRKHLHEHVPYRNQPDQPVEDNKVPLDTIVNEESFPPQKSKKILDSSKAPAAAKKPLTEIVIDITFPTKEQPDEDKDKALSQLPFGVQFPGKIPAPHSPKVRPQLTKTDPKEIPDTTEKSQKIPENEDSVPEITIDITLPSKNFVEPSENIENQEKPDIHHHHHHFVANNLHILEHLVVKPNHTQAEKNSTNVKEEPQASEIVVDITFPVGSKHPSHQRPSVSASEISRNQRPQQDIPKYISKSDDSNKKHKISKQKPKDKKPERKITEVTIDIQFPSAKKEPIVGIDKSRTHDTATPDYRNNTPIITAVSDHSVPPSSHPSKPSAEIVPKKEEEKSPSVIQDNYKPLTDSKKHPVTKSPTVSRPSHHILHSPTGNDESVKPSSEISIDITFAPGKQKPHRDGIKTHQPTSGIRDEKPLASTKHVHLKSPEHLKVYKDIGHLEMLQQQFWDIMDNNVDKILSNDLPTLQLLRELLIKIMLYTDAPEWDGQEGRFPDISKFPSRPTTESKPKFGTPVDKHHTVHEPHGTQRAPQDKETSVSDKPTSDTYHPSHKLPSASEDKVVDDSYYKSKEPVLASVTQKPHDHKKSPVKSHDREIHIDIAFPFASKEPTLHPDHIHYDKTRHSSPKKHEKGQPFIDSLKISPEKKPVSGIPEEQPISEIIIDIAFPKQPSSKQPEKKHGLPYKSASVSDDNQVPIDPTKQEPTDDFQEITRHDDSDDVSPELTDYESSKETSQKDDVIKDHESRPEKSSKGKDLHKPITEIEIEIKYPSKYGYPGSAPGGKELHDEFLQHYVSQLSKIHKGDRDNDTSKTLKPHDSDKKKPHQKLPLHPVKETDKDIKDDTDTPLYRDTVPFKINISQIPSDDLSEAIRDYSEEFPDSQESKRPIQASEDQDESREDEYDGTDGVRPQFKEKSDEPSKPHHPKTKTSEKHPISEVKIDIKWPQEKVPKQSVPLSNQYASDEVIPESAEDYSSLTEMPQKSPETSKTHKKPQPSSKHGIHSPTEKPERQSTKTKSYTSSESEEDIETSETERELAKDEQSKTRKPEDASEPFTEIIIEVSFPTGKDKTKKHEEKPTQSTTGKEPLDSTSYRESSPIHVSMKEKEEVRPATDDSSETPYSPDSEGTGFIESHKIKEHPTEYSIDDTHGKHPKKVPSEHKRPSGKKPDKTPSEKDQFPDSIETQDDYEEVESDEEMYYDQSTESETDSEKDTSHPIEIEIEIEFPSRDSSEEDFEEYDEEFEQFDPESDKHSRDYDSLEEEGLTDASQETETQLQKPTTESPEETFTSTEKSSEPKKHRDPSKHPTSKHKEKPSHLTEIVIDVTFPFAEDEPRTQVHRTKSDDSTEDETWKTHKPTTGKESRLPLETDQLIQKTPDASDEDASRELHKKPKYPGKPQEKPESEVITGIPSKPSAERDTTPDTPIRDLTESLESSDSERPTDEESSKDEVDPSAYRAQTVPLRVGAPEDDETHYPTAKPKTPALDISVSVQFPSKRPDKDAEYDKESTYDPEKLGRPVASEDRPFEISLTATQPDTETTPDGKTTDFPDKSDFSDHPGNIVHLGNKICKCYPKSGSDKTFKSAPHHQTIRTVEKPRQDESEKPIKLVIDPETAKLKKEKKDSKKRNKNLPKKRRRYKKKHGQKAPQS